MNPIYNAGRMIDSDNGGESVEELQRRAKLQKQLSGPRPTGMSRPSAKQQLDEILGGKQRSEVAIANSRQSASLQRASFPVPAPVADDVPSERSADANANDFETFEQVFTKYPQQAKRGDQTESDTGDSDSDDSVLRESVRGSSDKVAVPVSGDVLHPLDKLFTDLDIDVSAFSIDGLSSYLHKLTADVEAIRADRLTSRVPQSADKQALVGHRVSHQELLAALDFIEGYADSLFRKQTDRKQLDQSFNALREQLNLDQSQLVQHLAPAPDTNARSFQAGGEVSQRVQANHLAKKSAREVYRKSEDAHAAELDWEMESMTVISARIRGDNRIAESASAKRSNEQRKQKEKDDTTLPMIVQRSV